MKNIYAIRDRVAQDLVGHTMYLLMVFRTDAEATRYFADAILDPKSILAKHPADYELIACGTIYESGVIDKKGPLVIITGDALVAALGPQEPQLVKDA